MSLLETIIRRDNAAGINALVLGNNATHLNALGVIADDGSGNIAFRKWNGSAWAAVAIGATSVAALVGDVIGSPGANTAVGLTGTAGVVAMHGTAITSDAGQALTISGANYTVNGGAAPTFTFRAPNATGTGSTTGGAFDVRTGTGAVAGAFTARRGNASPFLEAGGSGGTAYVTLGTNPLLFLDGDEISLRTAASAPMAVFSVADGLVLSIRPLAFASDQFAPSIFQFPVASGPGQRLYIGAQASGSGNGGLMVVSSGLGQGVGTSHGHVRIAFGDDTLPALEFHSPKLAAPTPIAHLYCPVFRFDKDIADSAFIYIQQQTADIATRTLRIRSQDPWASASTNVTSSDIWYEVGPSVGDPPNPGQHVWWVGNVRKMELSKDALVMRQRISFTAASPSVFVIDAGDFAGTPHGLRIEGGNSSALVGDVDGGAVAIAGGSPAGGGLAGKVQIVNAIGIGMVTVMSKDVSHHAVAFCGNPSTGDLPAGLNNYMFVCNLTGSVGSNPVGGSVFASLNGCPFFACSNGSNFCFIGTNLGATPGAFQGFASVIWNGTLACVPIYSPPP